MLRAAVTVLVLAQAAVAYRSVCYYTNWAQYRHGKGKFVPEDVDPALCTHVIYAFAKIVNNDIKAYEWNDESTAWSTGMYERMLALKKVNPNLKIMLGTGGWNMGSAPFHAIAATDATRKLFAQNLVKFLRDHGFDGWDNDWEYPGSRGSPPDDKMNNVLLMREIRAAFDADSASTGRPRLELSEAIGIGKATMDQGYDVPALSQVVDFFNLMTYDIHGSFDGQTGHNAPLYPDPSRETGDQLHYNVDWCVQTLSAKGMPRDKMNLGIPTYGRSFTLDNPSNDGVQSPARRPGNAGQYSQEKGFISYYEVCQILQSGATVHSLAAQHAQYLVQGDQWIGFDDVASVQEKACYARQQGVGGVMYWALDLDDFSGATCGQGKYPLIHAANAEFQNPSTQQCRTVAPPSQQPGATKGPYHPPVTVQPTYIPPTHGPAGSYIPINPYTAGPPATSRPATSAPYMFTLGTQGPPATQRPFVPTAPPVATYVPAGQYAFTLPYFPGTQAPTGTGYHPAATLVPGGYQPVPTPAPTPRPVTFSPFTRPPLNTPRPSSSATSQMHGSQGYDCRGKINDFYVDPASCSSFYICASQQAFKVDCARGLLFNPIAKHCDWATNVNCGYNTQPPVTYTPYVPVSIGTYRPVTNTPYNPTTSAPYNPATQAPANPATQAPGFKCSPNQSGIFSHPSDCRKYIQCSLGVQFTMTCPNKLLFNPNMSSCDFAVNVPQCLTG